MPGIARDVTANMRDYRLVFAILEHEVLGLLYEGYIIEVTNFRQFSLSSRKVNALTVKDYNIPITEVEESILRIMEDYSDEVILRKFSKGKVKPGDFYAELSSQVFQDHIRPYIEKRLHRISCLFQEHQIPVYYKGKRKDTIQERPIQTDPGITEVIFNFLRRDHSGTEYFLTIRSGKGEISLTGKKGKVLTLQPCWVFVEDTIYMIDERVDGNKLNPFFFKPFIHIPPSSEKKYYESFVLNAVRNFSVHSEGFSVTEPIKDCTPVIQPENNLEGFVRLALYFRYGNRRVNASDSHQTFAELVENEGLFMIEKTNRDKEKEQLFLDKALALGLEMMQDSCLKVAGIADGGSSVQLHDYIHWLNEHSNQLKENGFEIDQGFYNQKFYTGEIDLNIQVNEGNDWFDVNAVVQFGEFNIPFIRFRNHILNYKREFILPNGEIAILPDAWFSRYREMIQLGTANGDGMKLRKHHAGILRLAEPEKSLSFYDSLTQGIRQEEILQFRVPESIQARLRPYQLDGFKWMSLLQQHQLGGCLADDMGLGKTLQTLVLLANQREMGDVLRLQPEQKLESQQLNLFAPEPAVTEYKSITSLIVMPLSLIWNWDNEIRKFTPHLRVFKHVGPGRTNNPSIFYNYDIVLTTYGVVRNDLDMLTRCEFRYVILDESQTIKNPFSKLFKAVRQLRARNRLVLTGTPIENSLSDLWAQMTFLNNGILGNLTYFREEFGNPIEKNRDKIKEEKLRTMIAPFILRRTKEMVAKDLPSLTETVYYCEMSEEQREEYETRKSEIRNLILDSINTLGTEKARFAILRGLMQLRLLANHARLLPDGADLPSGKFDEVIRSISNILSEGHKILIFSSFVRHLKIFADYFNQAGWGYCILTGEKSTPERSRAVEEFQQNPEKKLFLITLKAGGVGLNLTAADYVFMLDPWWNPASENQAVSRAHRIGQDKKVIAFKYITRNTIEEKILLLQQNKSEIASLFVNNNDPLKFFTRETILQLTE